MLYSVVKEIPNGVYLTGFFSNCPTQRVMDEIFAFLSEKSLTPKYGKVFDFEHIKVAVSSQDDGSADGKIVVQL